MRNVFKRKPTYSIDLGGGAFIAEFYTSKTKTENNYLRIKTLSGVFEHIVRGYTFGYLLAAYKQGNEREILAYCTLIFRLSDQIYQDLGFCQDVIRAITKYDKRLDKQAQARAARVTAEDEQIADIVVRDAVKRAQVKKKDRKKAAKQSRKEIKEAFSEYIPSVDDNSTTKNAKNADFDEIDDLDFSEFNI
jgi:hypothetical protein